jgi:hypothetical protein
MRSIRKIKGLEITCTRSKSFKIIENKVYLEVLEGGY